MCNLCIWKNNKKYIRIDCYLKDTSNNCFYSEDNICQVWGFLKKCDCVILHINVIHHVQSNATHLDFPLSLVTTDFMEVLVAIFERKKVVHLREASSWTQR